MVYPSKALRYNLHSSLNQDALNNRMNPSNSDSNSPRVTLKLKAGARKVPQAAPTPPAPRPPSKAQQKPGAHWSDEYKQRMQADMDALTSR